MVFNFSMESFFNNNDPCSEYLVKYLVWKKLELDYAGIDYTRCDPGEFQSGLFHYADHVYEGDLFADFFFTGGHGLRCRTCRLAPGEISEYPEY